MTELSTNSIRLLDVKYGTSVDGPGLRTSIYCAGCEHHCPGCHNPQSWDVSAGQVYDINQLFEEIKKAEMNVTFTGGDPMLFPEGFIRLAEMIKKNTDMTIWCYTGYKFESLMQHARRRALAELCDVIVDGPYLASQRDLSLPFRGSHNQRIIDVPSSINGPIVELIF